MRVVVGTETRSVKTSKPRRSMRCRQAVIDGDEHPERRARVGVDQGQERAAGFVIVFGTFGDAFEKAALFGGEVAAVAERGEVFGADTKMREIFERQIDASALGVFADVAQDVGELEGDAGFFGEFFGARVGVAKDADADEADDGGNVVAVAAQVFEGGVGGVVRRTRMRRLPLAAARSGCAVRDPWRCRERAGPASREEY